MKEDKVMRGTIAIGLIIFFVISTARADEWYGPYGPTPNYKGTHWVQADYTIPTTSDVYLYAYGYSYHVKSHGGGDFQFYYQAPIFVDSYWEAYVSSPPELPGYLKMTEIFAYDLEPNRDGNEVSNQKGFNPSSPEIVPTGSPGFFTGKSGATYPATIETVLVSDLPGRLPGYDVSKIVDTRPGAKVYLMQATVPGGDFTTTPLEFTYEYMGYITHTDPCWTGPYDPNFPYQHQWQLNITNWSDINYINDLHVDDPWVIYPGYIQVVPPPNWSGTGVTLGRYGYQANPGSEISVGGGSLGVQWKVNGKTPAVVPGHVTVTMNQIPVGRIMNTMVVNSDSNNCGARGYPDGDLNKDCVVNLYDFAIFADEWLETTGAGGGGGGGRQIVGVGFVFDPEDTKGPAQIVQLYDQTSAQGLLDTNDIIEEYRGVTITSGAHLNSVIESMNDVSVGQPVPMVIVKSGTITSKYVAPVAQLLQGYVDHNPRPNNKCVSSITTNGKKSCHCADDPYNQCTCFWEYMPGLTTTRTFTVRVNCSDNSPSWNQCYGDWYGLK